MLEAPPRRLHGPGPSPVHPNVLQALGQPCIGHMDPAFMEIMDGVRSMLQKVFKTDNAMTLACSGTGSAGAEMLMDNLVEPGDCCLIGVNGVFGGRLADKAGRAGGTVHTMEIAWGDVFDLDSVKQRVADLKPKLVALVHAETSTGAHQPFEGLADEVHKHGGLLVMDCVTSLAGVPVEIDAWGVDAAYSGTQKCLSCPPGLSPVTLNDRAMQKVKKRKTKCNSWYLDLSLVGNYWDGDRAYHHTAPVNMNYGLHEALRLILEEGLEARFDRHRKAHEKLRDGLTKRGFKYVTQEGHVLPMLNCVELPKGVGDEGKLRKRLLDEFNLEVGAGLGAFKGKCWRIGIMGEGARDEHVDFILESIDAVLN